MTEGNFFSSKILVFVLIVFGGVSFFLYLSLLFRQEPEQPKIVPQIKTEKPAEKVCPMCPAPVNCSILIPPKVTTKVSPQSGLVSSGSKSPSPVVCPPPPPPPPQPATYSKPFYSRALQSNKTVISFSIFGTNPWYVDMALLNIKLARELYPGWACWFFIDRTMPIEQGQRITNAGGEIYIVTDPQLTNGAVAGAFWRFFVFEVDPDVSLFICRDVDSLLGKRERFAVDAWMKSDFLFHSMRDNPHHQALILAGMWGAKRGGLPPNMIDRIRVHIKHSYGHDQEFLANQVWPWIQGKHMMHDAYYCDRVEVARPFPQPREWVNGPFVGAYCKNDGTCDNIAPKYSQGLAPLKCRPTPEAISG